VIGKPEWIIDPKFATPEARLDKLAFIFDTIEAWTKTKTKFEVMEICNPLDIPCGKRAEPITLDLVAGRDKWYAAYQ
jgi:formyl-CoA transferase